MNNHTWLIPIEIALISKNSSMNVLALTSYRSVLNYKL